MLRWFSSILILCLAFASVEAATDVDSRGGCDEQIAHEMQGEFEDPLSLEGNSKDPASPGGEQSIHFCHCAVHAPAMLASAELIAVTAAQPAPSIPTYLRGTCRTPPPVRPPKTD